MQKYFTDLASGKRVKVRDIGVERIDGETPDLDDFADNDSKYEKSSSQSDYSQGGRRKRARTVRKSALKNGPQGGKMSGQYVSDFAKTIDPRQAGRQDGGRRRQRGRTSEGGVNLNENLRFSGMEKGSVEGRAKGQSSLRGSH